MSATDPGADAISFFLNGANVGTDGRISGTRTASKNLGTFADEGTFTYTGQAQDKDGAFSNTSTQQLTVLNVAPTITQLTQDLVVKVDDMFDFSAAAIDPGILDILTFDWDFDMDGIFDDFTGTSGQWSFDRSGTYDVALRVSDGDGGFAYGSFTVSAVPEPSSVLSLLGIGVFGAGAFLKGKRR
ncbi:MAG: PEP-CTERM sorting domain-containing protein [Symploca sp. SIO3E6]|nr:PEP-CTERM sorting domain-containing protein [Caldora sp. SIO3E6]